MAAQFQIELTEAPPPSRLHEFWRLGGTLSEGMLFDIGYADGITPVLATPEAPVPAGSRAG